MIDAAWKRAIVAWAVSTHELSGVWIVGSRARGTAGPDSDLDVAIELKPQYGYGEWVFLSDGWQQSLQATLPVTLHLLRGEARLGNDVISAAILDYGIHVYPLNNPQESP